MSGRGSNLAALLDAVAAARSAEVALVLSNKAEAGALTLARSQGIPAEVLTNPADGAEWIERLTTRRIDLVVLAGYLKLVPKAVVEAWSGRILNIHPALLPRHGGPGMYGRRVHEAVLAAGEA